MTLRAKIIQIFVIAGEVFFLGALLVSPVNAHRGPEYTGLLR